MADAALIASFVNCAALDMIILGVPATRHSMVDREETRYRIAESRQDITAVQAVVFLENQRLLRRPVNGDPSFERIDEPHQSDATAKVLVNLLVDLGADIGRRQHFDRQVRSARPVGLRNAPGWNA